MARPRTQDPEPTYLRGQYFSFDAVIASVIFLLAVVSLLSYWHNVKDTFNLQSSEIQKEAFRVSELLFNPGFPSAEPDCARVQQLGFARSLEDRRFDVVKIDCASRLDEATFKGKIGTPYNVSIYINEFSGATIRLGDDLLEMDQSSLKEISKVTRVVSLYEDEEKPEKLATVEVYLYQ